MSIQPRVHQLVRQHETSDIFSLLSEEEINEFKFYVETQPDKKVTDAAISEIAKEKLSK